jgi:hypothetical protein
MTTILTKTIYVASFPLYINDIKDVICERFPESDFTITLQRAHHNTPASFHVEGTLTHENERNVFAFTLRSLHLLNGRQIGALTYTNAIFTLGSDSSVEYEGRTSLGLIAIIVKLCGGQVFVSNTKQL